MSVESIHAAAAAGRGLWAGLFVLPCPSCDGGPCVHQTPRLPAGAHVTLGHYGRKVTRERVDRAILACRGAAAQIVTPVNATSWARGRMDQSKGSVEALLLEGVEIYTLHEALQVRAQALGVSADRTFEFHPHVTLGHLQHEELCTVPKTGRVKFVFTALTLVCGEARLHFDFGAAETEQRQQIGLPF